MKIFGYSLFGYEGELISVDADLRHGIPAVDIVGLADGAVKESKERIKTAIKNSGLDFPEERVLFSLSPADLKKDGASFDLAMAIAVLCAKNSDADSSDAWLCYGELELSGRLRPARGTFAALQTAKKLGIKKAVIPAEIADAAIPAGIKAYKAENLLDAYRITQTVDLRETAVKEEPETAEYSGIAFPVDGEDGTIDDIKNPALVRAMMIAAAGRHHMLVVGRPGSGKTAALTHFPELLPALTYSQAQTTTRIHSLAGLVRPEDSLMRIPPFRTPHQSASLEGICGGGVNCRPGEISLAHNGVLFLDDAPEFRSSVLQMLRVPIETGCVTLSRAGRSTTYPARFQLIMTANPCPCGNFGEDGKICLCSSRAVEQYWRKFSAPLLARIPVRVRTSENQSGCQRLTLSEMRKKIAVAERKQRTRGKYNQYIPQTELLSTCALTDDAKTLIDNFGDIGEIEKTNVLKVARTIADLDGLEQVGRRHIEEAKSLSDLKNFPTGDEI